MILLELTRGKTASVLSRRSVPRARSSSAPEGTCCLAVSVLNGMSDQPRLALRAIGNLPKCSAGCMIRKMLGDCLRGNICCWAEPAR
jgi:hypothetical protein